MNLPETVFTPPLVPLFHGPVIFDFKVFGISEDGKRIVAAKIEPPSGRYPTREEIAEQVSLAAESMKAEGFTLMTKAQFSKLGFIVPNADGTLPNGPNWDSLHAPTDALVQ